MTDKEWTTFFALLAKVVDMPKSTVAEKVAIVKEKAADDGEEAEMNVEEFASWDFGS